MAKKDECVNGEQLIAERPTKKPNEAGSMSQNSFGPHLGEHLPGHDLTLDAKRTRPARRVRSVG